MDNITSVQTVYNPQELQRIQMLYSLMAIQEQRKQDSEDKKKKDPSAEHDGSLRYISRDGSAVTMTPNVSSGTLKAKDETKEDDKKEEDTKQIMRILWIPIIHVKV